MVPPLLLMVLPFYINRIKNFKPLIQKLLIPRYGGKIKLNGFILIDKIVKQNFFFFVIINNNAVLNAEYDLLETNLKVQLMRLSSMACLLFGKPLENLFKLFASSFIPNNNRTFLIAFL